jgi:hypothetical protein
MELMNELTQISNTIAPYKPGNKFKAVLYNFAPKGYQVKLLQEIRHQPVGDSQNYYPVDNTLFNEALLKNPDPDRLYPWQINSCTDLADRLSRDSKTIDMFGMSLERMESSLRDIENNFNVKTVERIKRISESQSKLLEKLCITRQKLEKFLEARNALSKDSGLEMRLYSKLEQIKKKLEIKNKIDKIDTSSMQSGKPLKIQKEHLEDVLSVLQQQRSDIANLRKIVMTDSARLQKVENVIEKYKNK